METLAIVLAVLSVTFALLGRENKADDVGTFVFSMMCAVSAFFLALATVQP